MPKHNGKVELSPAGMDPSSRESAAVARSTRVSKRAANSRDDDVDKINDSRQEPKRPVTEGLLPQIGDQILWQIGSDADRFKKLSFSLAELS